MEKFRVGVIGTGFIGAVHVETLKRLGNVEVVAISDVSNPQEKADKLFVAKGYSDYREMIDKENLDAVHICTPNYLHFEQALYALDHGVAVMCEKPLTTSVEQAQKMKEAADRSGLPCGINFMFRFNPMVMQVKSMVEHGDVGDVYSVHGSYLQDWLYFDTDYNWRLEIAESGKSRAFADIGSHWIDTVENSTGLRVAEVLADFATFHPERKKPKKAIDTYSGMALRPEDYDLVPITTEDYVSVLFHFDNGAHGSCVISQMFAGRKNQTVLSIGGSKCALHWDSETANELWVGRRETYNQSIVKDPSILYESTKKIISYPGGHNEGFADTFKQHFIKFYDALGKKNPANYEFATFSDGLREMVLCEKIIESAEKKSWVSV
jgi:predicted dehydrogenase